MRTSGGHSSGHSLFLPEKVFMLEPQVGRGVRWKCIVWSVVYSPQKQARCVRSGMAGSAASTWPDSVGGQVVQWSRLERLGWDGVRYGGAKHYFLDEA